jgi:hypothetical protein
VNRAKSAIPKPMSRCAKKAERFDRELNDIFEVQDEITQAIVTALKLRLQRTTCSEWSVRGRTTSMRTTCF